MEIRRSLDRLISAMGYPILIRFYLCIESGPSCSITKVFCTNNQFPQKIKIQTRRKLPRVIWGWEYSSHMELLHYTVNLGLSWCQHCHHWHHRRERSMSLETKKLASWQPSIFSARISRSLKSTKKTRIRRVAEYRWCTDGLRISYIG